MARDMKVVATFTVTLAEGSPEATAQLVLEAIREETLEGLPQVFLYNGSDKECTYDLELQVVELADGAS